jgi:hypothetical protein
LYAPLKRAQGDFSAKPVKTTAYPAKTRKTCLMNSDGMNGYAPDCMAARFSAFTT